jgi:hypothetical protein
MRTLKDIKALYDTKQPKEKDKTTQTPGLEIKSADEKRFADKHVIQKIADRNGNGDDVFNATNVKGVERTPKHGYNPGEDEKVYEEVEVTEEDILEYEQHIYRNRSGKLMARDDEGNERRYIPSSKRSNPPLKLTPDDKKPHKVILPNGKELGTFAKIDALNIVKLHGGKATAHPVEEEVQQTDEGYVSLAQQRAVWASRKDGGKGHPDNKKKKMKEEVELVDEGDVIHFPGKMKAEKEKPDTAPGWMLRKNPELAQKLKDAKDRVKKRKEIKEASKAPMDPEKKAKSAIDTILKNHEEPPGEKGMKIGEEKDDVPFEGPYTKASKKQPGQKSDPGYSAARHLARQAMQKMLDKKEKMKEEVEIDEVLKPSMGAGAYISDFVHSKNPKFAGKSKKERMKQALAAYYAAKRGE